MVLSSGHSAFLSGFLFATDAEEVLAEFQRAGVNHATLADELQREGAESFDKSWNDLMERIDSKRVAVMGFSRGGIASWRTAVERIITAQRLPDGLRFAAHIQMYSGGCSGVFRLIVKPGVFSKAPELWIHGEADDYTPIGPCRDYAQRIGEAGTPVEFVSLPGAYHKFDSDGQRREQRPSQMTQLDVGMPQRSPHQHHQA